jgi:hypothetical protein
VRGERRDRVEASRVPVGRESASSSGRYDTGESGVSKSVGGGSSGEDDADDD